MYKIIKKCLKTLKTVPAFHCVMVHSSLFRLVFAQALFTVVEFCVEFVTLIFVPMAMRKVPPASADASCNIVGR